jgi:hypothetical protein
MNPPRVVYDTAAMPKLYPDAFTRYPVLLVSRRVSEAHEAAAIISSAIARPVPKWLAV